ncbi:MAG: hypothetical protein ACKOBW_16760 [Planctomycetota bacterium]
MPHHNRFRHQQYGVPPPREQLEFLHPAAPVAMESDEWRQGMAAVGAALRAHRVAAIYLIHGTFVGDDTLGIVRLLERCWTTLGHDLRKYEKRLADRLVRDSGNYTWEYAQQFEREINQDESGAPVELSRRIPVRMLTWSSANHHLGRADGAVRLFNELSGLKLIPGQRLLLWGHSHGGNVLALLSNLLGSEPAERERFFQAARDYYQSKLTSDELRQPWLRAKERLLTAAHPLTHIPLDMVTFGTPIRYGWDTGGYAQLLHFLFHRAIAGLEPWETRFPFSLRSALSARRGDYIQQVGIAGSNFPPAIVDWGLHRADAHLGRVLQTDLPRGNLWSRLRAGQRAPDEGRTLLIDYEQAGRLLRSAFGHAIYTRQRWLLYHAAEVVRCFYGATS